MAKGKMPVGFMLVAGGVTFLYSGIVGKNPIDVFKQAVGGKPAEKTLGIEPVVPVTPTSGNPVTGAGYPGVPAGTPQGAMKAIAYAARQAANPTRDWYRFCLGFVELAHGVGGGYGNASSALAATSSHLEHSGVPPPGALVWWRENHVALSAGLGFCYSNDIKQHGKISLVRIGYITKHWGKTYAGWSRYLGNTRLF